MADKPTTGTITFEKEVKKLVRGALYDPELGDGNDEDVGLVEISLFDYGNLSGNPIIDLWIHKDVIGKEKTYTLYAEDPYSAEPQDKFIFYFLKPVGESDYSEIGDYYPARIEEMSYEYMLSEAKIFVRCTDTEKAYYEIDVSFNFVGGMKVNVHFEGVLEQAKTRIYDT